MSFLLGEDKIILPKYALYEGSFLGVISPLKKMAIIQEGEHQIARNSSKLNLTNSIYESTYKD
jgi:hypothetical protein